MPHNISVQRRVHQTIGHNKRTLADLLLMRRFAIVSTGWNTKSSAMPDVPDPKTRAVPDSLYFPPAGGDILSWY